MRAGSKTQPLIPSERSRIAECAGGNLSLLPPSFSPVMLAWICCWPDDEGPPDGEG